MSWIHFFSFVVGFAPLKIGNLLFQLPALLFHRFLFFGNRNLHLIETSMQLKNNYQSKIQSFTRALMSGALLCSTLSDRSQAGSNWRSGAHIFGTWGRAERRSHLSWASNLCFLSTFWKLAVFWKFWVTNVFFAKTMTTIQKLAVQWESRM